MVILSLFDGMSCGQIALRELGVTIDKYYASEIDKFAIQNTMANFPDTVQLGDVRQVDAKSLGKIDLLIGGSPCQCFSFAGKRAGMSTKSKEQIETLTRYLELKQQGFEFEGQSYLFWEYVRTPTECARLQTIPEWYKWEVSETQQYRMLGNGWTVEVIKHILSFLPDHLKK